LVLPSWTKSDQEYEDGSCFTSQKLFMREANSATLRQATFSQSVVCAVLSAFIMEGTDERHRGQRALQPSRSTFHLLYFTIGVMPWLPFITFEGSEGCGKSTQVERLAGHLDRLGIAYLLTREPGGTPIGETIRELLQFAPHNSSMTPETELLLFEASRSQLVRETIKPALERGTCVIA